MDHDPPNEGGDRGKAYARVLDVFESRSPVFRRSILNRVGVRGLGYATAGQLEHIAIELGMKPD
jgi:hypothetical protein